jgi:hypothetical protein
MKTMTKSLLALMAFIPVAICAPTEINYQGVLTDQNGNPVNGVRAMQIKIYDAPSGGTLLYSEDLGNVPVQDGIYSFSFGANGTSNALTTETIAIANGTVSKRHGTGSPVIVPYQTFDTSDHPICLAPGNDRLWARCAVVLGRPDWATDPCAATQSEWGSSALD